MCDPKVKDYAFINEATKQLSYLESFALNKKVLGRTFVERCSDENNVKISPFDGIG